MEDSLIITMHDLIKTPDFPIGKKAQLLDGGGKMATHRDQQADLSCIIAQVQ